jgi:hypothetical protein
MIPCRKPCLRGFLLPQAVTSASTEPENCCKRQTATATPAEPGDLLRDVRARLTDDHVLGEYICHFMKADSTKKKLIEGGTGTNIKSLNQATLSSLIIPIAPLAQQKRIVTEVESLHEESEQLASIYERMLVALDALKKSVLHQAFTGEL